MNEGKKTAIFWIAAALMLGIGGLVSWQPTSNQQDSQAPINQTLFKFKDPLTAASMRIVTFDEGQGSLDTFEVRKDRESGAWIIPSRDGYPADAVEQMKNAANSLVDLRALETIFAEPSDHEDFGVVEPNLEDLNVGDEGVGRLVTFKDADQKTLASLILGDPVKDQEGQLYVRKPNQDPVYVVSLDDTPLTTEFQDWIEDDLLKLSSIDIEGMQVKDYNATVNPLNGQIALTRKYDVDLSLDGSTWKLEELKEYDPKNPLADPKKVEVGEEKKLNSAKLNEIKNALDDVKIANVVRKPEGMSANLKADKDLAADQKAVQSLATHGFYPVQLSADGETEILSANGELVVGLNDGVEYLLRFGNISGLTKEEESDDGEQKTTSGGVNRYLLVTARVDDGKFPAPALKPIPQSIDEVEGFGKSDEQAAEESSEEKVEELAPSQKTEKPESAEPTDADQPLEGADKTADEAGTEEPADEKQDGAATSGETEISGGGQASGSGQGQEPDDEDASQDGEAAAEKTEDADVSGDNDVGEDKDVADPKQEAKTPADEPKSADQPADAAADKSADEDPASESKDAEMSEEEKQELLEAEQEKITKENQRKLDERKDKIEAAKKRVRELNARFADWYYVIPEDTYAKLRIKRDELFEEDNADASATSPAAAAPPGLNFQPPK